MRYIIRLKPTCRPRKLELPQGTLLFRSIFPWWFNFISHISAAPLPINTFSHFASSPSASRQLSKSFSFLLPTPFLWLFRFPGLVLPALLFPSDSWTSLGTLYHQGRCQKMSFFSPLAPPRRGFHKENHWMMIPGWHSGSIDYYEPLNGSPMSPMSLASVFSRQTVGHSKRWFASPNPRARPLSWHTRTSSI